MFSHMHKKTNLCNFTAFLTFTHGQWYDENKAIIISILRIDTMR